MLTAARTRQDERRKGFKKGLDARESRNRRVEESVQIRKNKREELALKRRNINLTEEPTDDSFCFASATAKDLAPFVQMIFSNNEQAVVKGARSVRKILSQAEEPPIDELIQTGVIPRLVALLDTQNEEMRLETAWALTNVASGTSEHTAVVLKAGAVPAFVEMSRTAKQELNREQATWALGNIAGDSCQSRDYVLSCGAMAPLVNNLKISESKSFLRNGSWALSNLVRGKPAPALELIVDCLAPLKRLLYSDDEEILGDACWAISYITDGDEDRIQAVVDAGMVPRLVKLMRREELATPALRAVGNIITGNEEQTQSALDVGALLAVRNIMESTSERAVLKECCWVLSNVTAGTSAQIQTALRSGVTPILFHLMEEGDFEVRKEAAWAVTNAISGGNYTQVDFLVEEGGLDALVSLLYSHDVKVMTLCLESVAIALKAGEVTSKRHAYEENSYAVNLELNGGLEVLEDLQNHSNSKIHTLATDLLDQYFEADEENLFAGVNNNNNNDCFSFGIPQQQSGGSTFAF